MDAHYAGYYVSWVETVGRVPSLDTLRGFGRLKQDGADESDQQANYSLHPAEEDEPGFVLLHQMRWIKLLQAENENLTRHCRKKCRE